MTDQLLRDRPAVAKRPGGGWNDLWRPEAWATLRLAVPLALAQLAHVAITTTDVVMISWLGPEALAAGTLGTALYFPIFLLGLGILSAVGPLTAQALGAHRLAEVPPVLRQGLLLAALLGLPTGLLLWWGGALFLALGQDAALSSAAQAYLRAILWGLAPSFMLVVFRNFLAAHSRPRAIMVVMIFGIALNGLGNYVLMYGYLGFPALGLVGVGLSTTLVNCGMFLALLVFVARAPAFRSYRWLAAGWRPDGPLMAEFLRIGLPIGLAILAESGLFNGVAFLMGWIGTTALAAHAVAIQCMAVAFMIPLGISQAATVRVGLAAGAGDWAGVIRAGWTAIGLGVLVALIPAGIFVLAPGFLAGLYLDPAVTANQPAIELAIALLGIAALFQVFDGTQVIAMGVLRGLKDTRVPMWLVLLGCWGVGFSAAVLFGPILGFGATGIWYGLAVGLAVTASLTIGRIHLLTRRWSGVVARP